MCLIKEKVYWTNASNDFGGENEIIEITKQKPYHFVMRDGSMANDSVATNFDQIFASYSADTIRKVI